MSELTPYIDVLLIRDFPTISYPDGFVRRAELVPVLDEIIQTVMYRYVGSTDLSNIYNGDDVMRRLAEVRVIESIVDQFAGEYYRIIPSRISDAKISFLAENFINLRAGVIGTERYFRDVFIGAGISDEKETEEQLQSLTVIPASDRIVRIDHNQLSQIENATLTVIDALSQENGVDGEPELRDRFLGQIRAGQELVRAQSIRSYLVYQTVVQVLFTLLRKYGESTLGIAAKKLLELYIEHVVKS